MIFYESTLILERKILLTAPSNMHGSVLPSDVDSPIFHVFAHKLHFHGRQTGWVRGFGMLHGRKDLMAHMEHMIMGKPQSFGGFINRNKLTSPLLAIPFNSRQRAM